MFGKNRNGRRMLLLVVFLVAAVGVALSGVAVGEILDPGAENPEEGPTLTEWDPQLVNSSTVDTYQVTIEADDENDGIALIRQRPQTTSEVTQRINMNESFGDAMNPEIVAFEGDDGPQERIGKDILIDDGDVVVSLADDGAGAQQQARVTAITVQFEVESAADPDFYNFSVDMEAQDTTVGQVQDFDTLTETGIAQVEVIDAEPATENILDVTGLDAADEASQDERELEVTATVENPTDDPVEDSIVYGLAEDEDPAFDGTDLLTDQQNLTVDANDQATVTFFVDLTEQDEAINTGDDIRHGIAAAASESNLTGALTITDGPISHFLDDGEAFNRTTGLIQTSVDISDDADDDVVSVSPGIYGENVTVGVDNIAIVGDDTNGDKPIVAWPGPDAPVLSEEGPLAITDADNVSVGTLRFEALVQGANGIGIAGGSGHAVIDVEVLGTGMEDVPLETSSHALSTDVESSETAAIGAGLRIEGATNAVVSENTIWNTSFGISTVAVTEATIVDNEALDNVAGVVVDGSDDVYVLDNDMTANSFAGIGIIGASSDILVADNTVVDNGDVGIDVFESDTTTVYNNTISGAGDYGLGIINAAGNEIIENEITANGAGISLEGAMDNTFSGNLIADNDDGITSGQEEEPVLTSDSLSHSQVEPTQANSGNVFVEDTLSGNIVDAVLLDEDADFVETELDSATISATPANAVEFSAVDNVPEAPEDRAAVENTFLNITNTTEEGFIDLSIHYDEENVFGSQDSLEIHRYNETDEAWEIVDSTVDTENNTVSANVTEFSTFGVFSDPPTTAVSDLNIATEGDSAVIAEGADWDVEVNVTNFGADGSEIEVNLSIGEQIDESQTTDALDDGESITVVFENVTSDFLISADAYPVNASTEHDNITGELRVHPDVGQDGSPARDTTGDGLLNDVNGDGEFSIVDIQHLFAFLHSEEVQTYAFFFDFAGVNEDRTSVFDIQALFTQLQAQSG